MKKLQKKINKIFNYIKKQNENKFKEDCKKLNKLWEPKRIELLFGIDINNSK